MLTLIVTALSTLLRPLLGGLHCEHPWDAARWTNGAPQHATIAVTVDTYGHGLGAGGSMVGTMGDILSRVIGDGTAWLANG